MTRIFQLLIVLSLVASLGCAGHSSRHTNRARIELCPSVPCGSKVTSGDMTLDYSIVRETSGEYVLSGTLSPRGVVEGTKVDMAVVSFELVRDITVFDSFSFPVVGRELTVPLRFSHRFTPSGGFDGIMFNWDIRFKK